jgi:hypothetical protein
VTFTFYIGTQNWKNCLERMADERATKPNEAKVEKDLGKDRMGR